MAGLSNQSNESLTVQVRNRIEEMILNGEIGAGERLNENAIAAELNVSRGPVREATRQLAEAGLATVIRNRGVFVREVSLEDALNVYDVRAGLAHVAGRLAARRAKPEDIDKLRELWAGMEVARQSQDSDKYYEINREFHRLIFEITCNPRLIAINASTEREVFLFLRRGVIGPMRLGASNKQHEKIVEAIAEGDEQEAAKAFEYHIMTGKTRMLDTLATKPRYS